MKATIFIAIVRGQRRHNIGIVALLRIGEHEHIGDHGLLNTGGQTPATNKEAP